MNLAILPDDNDPQDNIISDLKGTHTLCKQISKYKEPKCVNPKTWIMLLKPWNSICNKRYRTPNLTGGAPFVNVCLYLQSGEDF